MSVERTKPELLEDLLRGHDEPCPGCGYSLRGLRGGRCPECDSALELRVGLVEPRQGAFIAGLVGLSMGLGLSALLLLYACVMILRFGFSGGPPLWVFFGYNGVAALVHGLAVLLWIRSQRRLRLAAVRTRWTLAVLGWALSLVNLGIFSLIVR